MKKLDLASLAVTSFDIPLPDPEIEVWTSCTPECGGNTVDILGPATGAC
jgi:hypothetical protein